MGKTRMAGLQSGEGRVIIDSVVWAQYINVTDIHTHSHVTTAIASLTHCVRAAKTETEIKKNFETEFTAKNCIVIPRTKINQHSHEYSDTRVNAALRRSTAASTDEHV